MIRLSSSTALMVLGLVAALDLGGSLPAGFDAGFLSAAQAQDDDDGGDDDDDDDDDDGGPSAGGAGGGSGGGSGGGIATPTRPRVTPAPSTPRRVPPVVVAAPVLVAARGEIVVSGLSDDDLSVLLAEGFSVIETLPLLQDRAVLRLRVPDGLSIEDGRVRVRARPSGQNADFNHYYRAGQGITPASGPVYRTAAAPQACTHLNCAMLTQIGWPNLRSDVCQASVEIGVIDTGVNLDHAGLQAAQVELIRLTGDDQPASGETHGTAVVSLLVGAETRAPGLLPEAKVVVVDIFSLAGGDERADVAHLVQALDLLVQRGVRVANLSLAGPENAVLTDMLAVAATSGMLVVAAAGNGGPAAPPSWPAAADTVLAVTAVDSSDRIYRRAQRGLHLDLAAPGVEVWSAASVKGVKPRTGTSYATPFATAAAAILMSRDPALTPTAAIETLRSLTRDLGAIGADEVFGTGVLTLADLCDTGH